MKEACDKSIPILHISWITWSLTFKRHMNYNIFDIENINLNTIDIERLMESIYKLEDKDNNKDESDFEEFMLKNIKDLYFSIPSKTKSNVDGEMIQLKRTKED